MSLSNFAYPYVSTYRGPSSEIYDVFGRHVDSLLDLQSKANQAINEWKTDLKNQIEEHAYQQKCLVADAYRVHKKHLDDMREQFVETYNIYRQKNDTKEIERLLEKCKNFQVELINSKRFSVKQDFIEITLIEPSEQIDREERNPKETSGNAFQNRSITSVTIPVNNKDFTTSSHSTSTTSASDQTNQPLTTQSVYDRNQSKDINVNNNPKTDLNDDSSSSDKCPTCFMIFPSYMSEFSRQIHVEDHYKD